MPHSNKNQNPSLLTPLPADRVSELGKAFFHYVYGYMEIIIAENEKPQNFFGFMDEQYYQFIEEMKDEGLFDDQEVAIVNDHMEHLKLTLKAIALQHMVAKKRQLLKLTRWMEEAV